MYYYSVPQDGNFVKILDIRIYLYYNGVDIFEGVSERI